MRRRREGLAIAAALVMCAATAAPAVGAERFYGVTKAKRLVTFNSDSPGATRSSKRIVGLGRATILAIDVRRMSGQIYGVASNDRLYTIDPRTARARRIGPQLFGQRSRAIGLDFNPSADKIRLVNGAGQNARVDPDTGRLLDGDADLAGAQPDAPLRYDANDRASRSSPRVGAVAYANRVPGATSSALYGIDQARNTLVLLSPPNDGVLKTVGRLRVSRRLRIDAKAPVGFDVAGNGRAYAAFRVGRLESSALLRVNLRTGRTSPTATLPFVDTSINGRADPLLAFTAAGRVADDRTRPRINNRKLNDPLISGLLEGRVLRLAVSCNEACGIVATFRLGRRTVGGAVGAVGGQKGRATLKLKLSRQGKRLVRRRRPKVLKVGLLAFDAAGNVSRTNP